MARHRRRRGFGDYISVPSFSGLKDFNPLGRHVNSTDVVVGAGVGLALGAVVKYGVNKANASLKKPDGTGGLPAFIMSYIGPISTFLGGVAAYMLQKKMKSGKLFGASHAQGHLAGAAVAAFAPIFWTTLGRYGPKMADGTPFFSDYVMVPYGMLQRDQPFGLLTADGVRPRFSGAEDFDPMSAP